MPQLCASASAAAQALELGSCGCEPHKAVDLTPGL